MQGFCALCELQRHCTRAFNASGGIVRPVPIVQNLKGTYMQDYVSKHNIIHSIVLVVHVCEQAWQNTSLVPSLSDF